jgi:ABC-2 type transport system permease protein
MSTFRTVLQLEWRILKRDRSALAVLGIFALFLILAALAGGHQANSLANGIERTQSEEATRYAQLAIRLSELEKSETPLSAEDPRDSVWMGAVGSARVASLPPAPLASIAIGQRDLHPQSVRVTSEVHLTRERETETPMAGPTRLRTGAFDPAFLFVILFPLVVIALSYELLSGERERGTLAMLLSQPVSQSELVMGKATARLSALSGATLLFAVLGLVVAGADLGAPGALLALCLYAGVLIMWAVFWFAAAILVNSQGGTSAKNALVLVGMWLILVIIVPGLVNVGVDTLHPPPSSIDLLHEAREATQDVEKELNGLAGRHDVDPGSGETAQRIAVVQEELARRAEPVHQEVSAQIAKRQSLLDSLRFLSPAILVQLALEDVAGSGGARHQRFEAQADAFHDAYRAFFSERIQKGVRMGTADLQAVPRFIHEEEASGALLQRIFTAMGALLAAAAGLMLWARRGLGRIGRLTR